MKEYNHLKGMLGEVRAKNFLKKQGYKILETNYSNHVGEIDIIARKGKTIVFVEVKARASGEFGLPREAVTEMKQNKIRSAASLYLLKHKLTESEVRFDVIEVLDDQITHLEGCF